MAYLVVQKCCVVPCTVRGLEERADDVVVIDDDNDTVDMDLPVSPLTIKVEAENITIVSEQETVEPHRNQQIRTQRVPFSPTVMGQYHKAVECLQTEGSDGGSAPFASDDILTGSTEEFNSSRTAECTRVLVLIPRKVMKVSLI